MSTIAKEPLLSEIISPQMILFICETTLFAEQKVSILSPWVGNYQSPYHSTLYEYFYM